MHQKYSLFAIFIALVLFKAGIILFSLIYYILGLSLVGLLIILLFMFLNFTDFLDAYDPLDPFGNITIKWDVISWTADGYVVSYIYFA